jgi:thiosulfate/3-mercaptopyruvate sulfurtransferase
LKIKKTNLLGLVFLALIALLLSGCNKEEIDLTAMQKKAKEKPIAHPEYLISAEQLKKKIGQANLTIIDARDRNTYQLAHIPGAICYNMKALSDPNRRGRFTSPKLLSLSIREFGVNMTDHIVIYSDNYYHASLWFYLHMYGLENVQILNGGFEQWKAKGYEIAGGRERKGNKGQFKITEANQKVKAIAETGDIVTAMENPSSNIIIDTRSPQEYSGGHIPGAVNITWDQLINEDKTFKTTSELDEIFTKQGVTQDKQIITYSNNFYRASYIYFALTQLLGYEKVKVYDGFYLYWSREKPLSYGSK